MNTTSREIVHRTLNFDSPPRVPRDLWVLPIAADRYPEAVAGLNREFPVDIVNLSGYEKEPAPTHGNQFGVGEYTDEWGCTFVNIQHGVIGEVKEPLVSDWEADRSRIHIPREWLTLD